LVTKVEKFGGAPIPVTNGHYEEANNEDEEEGEGSNLGDPVSDPAALGTIEDF
jgi:CTD small phosphatase-like protein 2